MPGNDAVRCKCWTVCRIYRFGFFCPDILFSGAERMALELFYRISHGAQKSRYALIADQMAGTDNDKADFSAV